MTESTHVLLDLDGTLTHSEPGILGTLVWALTEEGLRAPTFEEARVVIGPPFEIGLPLIGVASPDVPRVIDRYRSRYEATGLFDATLYPGIEAMLEQLRADGHTLSLATAKPETSAIRILDHFGLTPHFDGVVAGALLTSERRTKAAVIASALERLSIDAGPNMVMVGDREHDVSGAASHGIPTIGVRWGYGSDDELHEAGVWRLAETPAEVPALVAEHLALVER